LQGSYRGVWARGGLNFPCSISFGFKTYVVYSSFFGYNLTIKVKDEYHSSKITRAFVENAKLEGCQSITLTCIGPGLVKTKTAQKEIEKVSAWMGMSLDEFYRINANHILDVESAGVGFAVSVVNAERYNGQEINSIQILRDAGISADEKTESNSDFSVPESECLALHIQNIVQIFNEQYNGWLQRNIFERQWVLRDFKKTVGVAADNFKKQMDFVFIFANER